MARHRQVALPLFESGEPIPVFFNPSAGRGRAGHRLERLRNALGAQVDLQPTNGPGHAETLAHEAASSGCKLVGAAGGDGTLHEVANGILRAERPDCSLVLFPAGSANDYAFSLGLAADWWEPESPAPTFRQVDVGEICAKGGKSRYFVNGAGIGLNGAVTFESRSIHGLQGVSLYSVALLRALWRRYRFPPLTVEMDGLIKTNAPTLAFSAAIGKREGNFLLAPDAQVDDGLFDYLHAGGLRWWEVLRYLPGMIRGRLPDDHPAIRRGRCRTIQLAAEEDLIIHVDGEMFSVPGEGVREVQIKMLAGRLPVYGRFAGDSSSMASLSK